MKPAAPDFISLARQILSQGRQFSFPAEGTSMRPFISSGDTLQIKSVSAGGIHKGDIIFYATAKGKVVVHRLRKRYPRGGELFFLTRGDDAHSYDKEISPAQVLGKVAAISHRGQTRQIERGWGRLINSLYSRLLPLSRWLYLAVRKLAHFPDEEELISRLAAYPFNQAQQGRIEQLLKQGLDWGYIGQRAQSQKVSALLHHNLERHQLKDFVPARALEGLKRAYYTNSARNILLLQQVKDLLVEFSRNQIAVIILKGIFLAEVIYQNLALRPASDIDLLIHQQDLERVNQVLLSWGYIAPANYQDCLAGDKPSSINTLYYRTGRKNKSCLHIHWHLVNSTWPLDFLTETIDLERIWAQAVKIEGIDAFTLSAEHQIIYLAQHHLTHNFDRLILATAIMAAVSYYGQRLDWKLLAQEAARFNLSWVAYQSLLFCSRRLNCKVSGLDLLVPKPLSLSRRLIRSAISRTGYSYGLAYLTYLLMAPGLRGRLRFIGRTIFPPPAILAHSFNLPSSQIGLRHYWLRAGSGLARLRL